MTHIFSADAPSSQLTLHLGKYFGRYLIIAAAMVAFGGDPFVAGAICLTGSGIAYVLFSARKSWGREIILSEEKIVLRGSVKGDREIFSSSIVEIRRRPETLMIISLIGSRRSAIVIGGEHFAADTWAKLDAAVRELKVQQ